MTLCIVVFYSTSLFTSLSLPPLTNVQHGSVSDAVSDGHDVPVGNADPHLQPCNKGHGVPVTEVETSL